MSWGKAYKALREQKRRDAELSQKTTVPPQPAAGPWVKIEDQGKRPRNQQRVIMLYPSGRYGAGEYLQDDFYDEYGGLRDPTHYASINPPEES